jgi:membrane protease YdiL (CAAX protease family)
MIILYIIFHAICGVIAFGWGFTYLQKEFALISKETRTADFIFTFFMSLIGGPIVVAIFFFTRDYKHGWSLNPIVTQEDLAKKHGKKNAKYIIESGWVDLPSQKDLDNCNKLCECEENI